MRVDDSSDELLQVKVLKIRIEQLAHMPIIVYCIVKRKINK